MVAKIATAIATPCAVLVQSIMPGGLRQLEMRAVQGRLLAGCPAGHDVVGDAVFRGNANAKSESNILNKVWQEMTPMRRFAEPEEIASAVLFLA